MRKTNLTEPANTRTNADDITCIALGANLPSAFGGPLSTLKQACARLGELGLTVLATSRYYETPCFPAGQGPDFVNAVCLIRGGQKAQTILGILHQIEDEFGRTRHQRWAGRVLDLDLICCGAQVLPDAQRHDTWLNLPLADQMKHAPDQLILPHPRLQDRAFVLVPMADVASDWFHPVLGLNVAQMVANLPKADVADVVPIKG